MFCFCWQIYERGRWSDYALAGIAAGLVVANKFNGAFTALATPAAHWMSYKSDANFVVLARTKFWLAITRAIVSLLAGSPYLLLAYDKYWAVASYQVSSLDFAM